MDDMSLFQIAALAFVNIAVVLGVVIGLYLLVRKGKRRLESGPTGQTHVCCKCGGSELIPLKKTKSLLDGRHGWKCSQCRQRMGAYRPASYSFILVVLSIFCLLLGLVCTVFLLTSGEDLAQSSISIFIAVVTVSGLSFTGLSISELRGKKPVQQDQYKRKSRRG